MKTILKKCFNVLLAAGVVFGSSTLCEAQSEYTIKPKVNVVAPEHDSPQLGFVPVDPHCLEVSRVLRRSAAERLGLERGDRIISVNGERVHTPGDLAVVLEDAVHYNNGRIRVVIDNVRARRGEPGASRYVSKTTYLNGMRPIPSQGTRDHHHEDHHHYNKY